MKIIYDNGPPQPFMMRYGDTAEITHIIRAVHDSKDDGPLMVYVPRLRFGKAFRKHRVWVINLGPFRIKISQRKRVYAKDRDPL